MTVREYVHKSDFISKDHFKTTARDAGKCNLLLSLERKRNLDGGMTKIRFDTLNASAKKNFHSSASGTGGEKDEKKKSIQMCFSLGKRGSAHVLL